MHLAPATPEIPVTDVAQAQRHYRDRMGFEINWHNEAGGIGAVSRGDCALFFRETAADLHPATFWIFTEDVDRACAEFSARGADIVEPVEDKPWGLRQFTLRDLHGHLFHFHHDP